MTTKTFSSSPHLTHIVSLSTAVTTMSTRRVSSQRKSGMLPSSSTLKESMYTIGTNDDNEQIDEATKPTFSFDGETYSTYQEMVNAKRQRNLNMLLQSGLLDAKAAIEKSVIEQKTSISITVRGLQRAKTTASTAVGPVRKSSRLAGQSAPDIYVTHEAGKIISTNEEISEKFTTPAAFFNNRVNDGSDLSISNAVTLTGKKWVPEGEDTVAIAEHFVGKTLMSVAEDFNGGQGHRELGSPTLVNHFNNHDSKIRRNKRAKDRPSPASMSQEQLLNAIDALSLNNPQSDVAKVTPERIYTVACHPSPHCLIVCAGDKAGHLGIWNVDQYHHADFEEGSISSSTISSTRNAEGDCIKTSANDNDGVHIFKPHNGAISSLLWSDMGTKLLSTSYDGSVRSMDLSKQVFEEIFATYDDDLIHKGKIGYGLDKGHNSWIQSMEMDHRYGNDGKCFFLSTSEGNVIHVDLRTQGKVTFEQTLSLKKINTMSLHPDGHIMATAGLNTMVELWDVRMMGSTPRKLPKPFALQHAGRSINSAFFSPSGKYIVSTTMANKIEILEDAHLANGVITPSKKINHDNQTGRWLSTFMARWHPNTMLPEEIFVVGSMIHPRTIEIYSGKNGTMLRGIQGEALTAVASRSCFHPNANKLIVVGGNSSGRVTVAR